MAGAIRHFLKIYKDPAILPALLDRAYKRVPLKVLDIPESPKRCKSKRSLCSQTFTVTGENGGQSRTIMKS